MFHVDSQQIEEIHFPGEKFNGVEAVVGQKVQGGYQTALLAGIQKAKVAVYYLDDALIQLVVGGLDVKHSACLVGC